MLNPIFERYDSWAAYVDACKASGERYPNVEGWRGRASYSIYGADFYGTETWAEAIDLAENGWDTVRPTIERLAEDIKEDVRPLLADTFRSDFDVAGAAVDIGRFLEGEPECMVQLTPVKVAKPGRVISILVNTGARFDVSAKTIQTRGAVVCALVELLELLQHSTEVWAESTATHVGQSRPNITVLIKVKAADEKLDAGKLAFALCNPAMHRRLMFSRRYASGFGTYMDMGSSIGLTQQDTTEANVVLDTVLRHEVYDPAGWIREKLAEFALLDPTPTV